MRPVERFRSRGLDFITAASVDELARGMNALAGSSEIDATSLGRVLREHDEQAVAPAPTDPQIEAVRAARAYIGDRLIRVAKPHPFLDPRSGPLVAVRLWILTRKTLGGLETDLSARVLGTSGAPIAGLFAAGEVSGFGGGGMHGYRSLEGTFLGGCIFSGRVAGRAAAS